MLEKDGQNRPINYECLRIGAINSDMLVPMYPNIDILEDYTKFSDMPTVPCEYSHAMGNSNGNFNKIWEIIYKNLNFNKIWDWVDQGFTEVGKGGRKFWAYGGDYGERMPSDGNFDINGIVNPDRNPHPSMAEIKYSQQNVGFDYKNGILNGLLIMADKLIEFNALRNSVEDFDDQDLVDLPYQGKNFRRNERIFDFNA